VYKHAAAVAFHSVQLQNLNIFQTAWRDSTAVVRVAGSTFCQGANSSPERAKF